MLTFQNSRFIRLAACAALWGALIAQPCGAWCQENGQGQHFNERARDAELAGQRRDGLNVLPERDKDLIKEVHEVMAATLAGAKTLTADIEYSKRREEDRKRRKYYFGSLQILRDTGGRVDFTRKGNKEEYIANRQVIWSVDYDDKEAQFIPSSTPIVKDFLQEGLKLNAFLAMEPGTLEVRGTQPVEGEECWIVTGESPKRLETVGVPQSKVRVWVAMSDGLPRQISIPDEDDLLIILRNVKLNEPVSPEHFNWSPPKGIKTKNIFGF